MFSFYVVTCDFAKNYLLSSFNICDNYETDLWVFSCDRDAGREGAVDGEDDTLRGRRYHGQRHVQHRVVAANEHSHREDPVTHGVLCKKVWNKFIAV